MEDLGYLKFSLAREALEKGDEVSAIALLQESLALNEHFKSYELLGDIFLKRKDLIQARQYLEKAHGLNHRNDKTATLLAETLAAQGDSMKAIRVLEDLILRNKNYGPAQKLLKQLTNQWNEPDPLISCEP